MKVFFIVVLCLMILVLLGLSFYLVVGYFSYRFCLTRKGHLLKWFRKNFDKHLENIGADKNYFTKDFTKISIQSEDNLKLVGFYKNKGNSKLAIMVHGYGANHNEMSRIAGIFDNKNYDILAIDVRSHGESQGNDLTMGKEESKDLKLWINHMLEKNKDYKIVLFGLSMGASTVCLTVDENLPKNVVLAIEDCGYDNAEKQFSYVYSTRKYLPKFLFKIFLKFTQKTIGFNLKEVDTLQSLKTCKIPVMFIHGEKDDFVPTEMVYSMSAQIPESRRNVYIASDTTHAMASAVDFERYKKEITRFLNDYKM